MRRSGEGQEGGGRRGVVVCLLNVNRHPTCGGGERGKGWRKGSHCGEGTCWEVLVTPILG